MSAVTFTREERAAIRLARYRKRALAQRVAAQDRKDYPNAGAEKNNRARRKPRGLAFGSDRQAGSRVRAFDLHIVGSAANQLPVVDRVRAFLALDRLELRPILDGLDHLRPESERGKHITAYELRDVGTGRGKVGRLSLTFVAALSRMHPGQMATALCLNHGRDSYAGRAIQGRSGGL